MDKRKRRRILRYLVSSAVLLTVLALLVSGFMPEPVEGHLGKVVRKDLEVTVDESGKTRLRARHVVSAPVTGELRRIALRAGDQVAQGQVLACIDPLVPQLLDPRARAEAKARILLTEANLARAEATVQRALAAFQLAQQQVVRMRQLREQSGASQQALDQAEFERRAAEQDVASAQFGAKVAENERLIARTALDPARTSDSKPVELRSPIAGRVLRVLAESEGAVALGAPLLELGDPRDLEIVVDVLTTEAVAIRPGAKAHIERWGGDEVLEAKVRAIEPSAFTTRSALGVEEQRVPVVLELTSPPAKYVGLSDGYRVETRIETLRVPNALLVPNSAVFRKEGSFRVFVMRGDEVRLHHVSVGARTPDWVEVKSGLGEGERVVLYPSDQVRDGVRLREAHNP